MRQHGGVPNITSTSISCVFQKSNPIPSHRSIPTSGRERARQQYMPYYRRHPSPGAHALELAIHFPPAFITCKAVLEVYFSPSSLAFLVYLSDKKLENRISLASQLRLSPWGCRWPHLLVLPSRTCVHSSSSRLAAQQQHAHPRSLPLDGS